MPRFDNQSLPLDVFLRNYFRAHKAIGSKDRKVLCEWIYGMIRWRGALDWVAEKPLNWESRYRAFAHFSPSALQKNPDVPPHIQVSFPKTFYNLLANSLGNACAHDFCLCCNESAPTTIRVNTLKISRETLLEKWKGLYPVEACAHSPVGIRFKEKINFFGTPEFKEGFFEVQDEASQLIADLVRVKPTEHFLDFCAGSGGKSLAIAPRMKGTGQLYLHDIRNPCLAEAKKRLKRAGIQNAQLLFYDSANKKKLKGKMDWVLVDAPCTGTGTLRRNPDRKWKFDDQMLERLVKEQRAIFEEAMQFLKPAGHIVYATCSVLPEENTEQADYFTQHFPLQQIGEPFACFPKPGEMDGFFGVVFQNIQQVSKI